MPDRRILIVEDESIVRLHLRRIVEAMGHRVVGMAASAEEALASAESVPPELVLMDINLRGDRDGVDVAEEIVRRHGCAVVFATAFADDETLRRTESVGAVGYMLKPFGEPAVRAAITTALSEHDRVAVVKASERSLTDIIGSLGEAVLMLDTELKVNYLNPRARDLAWTTDGDALGQLIGEILHPADDDGPGFHEAVERARRDGTPTLLPTLALQDREGRETLVNGSIEPVNDGAGITGFVISLRDLTQRWFGADDRKAADSGAGPRMLIYSHDTFGLGHLRRSLNVAAALVATVPDLSILLVTGSALAHRFPLPPRVDYIKLPAVRKVASERYSARSLEVPDDDVLSIRANLMLRTVKDFRPDLLLVDHSPIGMRGELRPALSWLRDHQPGCETIIGLRDILDDPATVARNWREQGIYRLLEEAYDHVVIYGNPEFYDPVSAYGFPPSVAERVRFLGHVVEDADWADDAPVADGRRRIVVTTGGGDGAVELVAGGFLRMLEQGALAADVETVILPGPLAPPDVVAGLKAQAERVGAVVHDFVDSTSPYMATADLVISTAGYNTSVQLMRYGRRALMIPRVMHRREQQIRAARLAEMGLVHSLASEDLDPERLRVAVTTLLDDPREPLREARERNIFRFDGAAALGEFCATLIAEQKRTTEAAHE